MEQNLAMMASKLTVQFLDVGERYVNNEDIECKYTFNNYTVQEGDRIAIFRMGWKSLRNYVLFEWAVGYSLDVNYVIFSKYDLPSNTNDIDDLFQFCYISGENVVQGISTPFQISCVNPKPSIDLLHFKTKDNCEHLQRLLSQRDKEIMKLKEENAILKESLKSVVEQRKFQQTKSCNKEIDDLKDLTMKLRDALVGQQKEIDAIKIEMKKDKTAYKNLMLEKIIAEKKFEALSSKKEASMARKVVNFDYGNLQSIPAFPFDNFE